MAGRPKVQKESFTGDMEVGQPSDLIIPAEGVIAREPEAIAVLDKPLNKAYADDLAFGEDVLDIMLQPSSEENAPMIIDVYVNGEAKWIPVGERVQLKRKFVEVLMRSKPISIQTNHEDIGSKMVQNRVIRNQRSKYPLSIIHDPSPKSAEWQRRTMMEAA